MQDQQSLTISTMIFIVQVVIAIMVEATTIEMAGSKEKRNLVHKNTIKNSSQWNKQNH